MIDQHILNKKSIKYHIRKYLLEHRNELANKTVLDIPAGNGATSEILSEMGIHVLPFDLFPEYFMVENLTCQRADVMQGIPIANHQTDVVICQEGIEHFSDQLKVFKEFNRVLRPGGTLLISTPSYSSLAARMSYLLFESETHHQMPPNEIDDVWMSDKSITPELYHGHIFLVGVQKLRILARLAGFRIKDVRFIRLSKGSLALFPLFYPVILATSVYRYYRWLRKNGHVPLEIKRSVYTEQLKLNICPRHLLNRHTFIVFEKEKESREVDFSQESIIKPFDKIM